MNNELKAEDLISALKLSPLPWEGGYYRETWRSAAEIPENALGTGYAGARSAGTAIYYLLTPETVSRMHRLPSDETFHFYLGDPVDMLLLHPSDGASGLVTFGQNLAAGQVVQFTVPGDVWMGAHIAAGGTAGYALMGTTVSPGFDFDDLEMGDADALIEKWPDARRMIELLR